MMPGTHASTWVKLIGPIGRFHYQKNTPLFSDFLWSQTRSINCRQGNILNQSQKKKIVDSWKMYIKYRYVSILNRAPLYRRNRSIFSQTPTLFGENTPLLEVPGPHQSVTKIIPFRRFFFFFVDI